MPISTVIRRSLAADCHFSNPRRAGGQPMAASIVTMNNVRRRNWKRRLDMLAFYQAAGSTVA